MPQPNNESGRSLIEMLGTIGIITMITVGAIAGINTATNMWKASQTQEQVMEIIQGIIDINSWRRDGWSNAKTDHADLCTKGDFSSCNDGVIQLALGDPVDIKIENTYTDEGEIADSTLIFTLYNVNFRAVNYLLTKADGKLISEVVCDNCIRGKRGNDKIVRFIHRSEVIEE
ncbi:MAG: hypothetical protein IKV03_02290 [Alphaproteobacteria bacterium]|nr:hypothetical protein [Alphaproteobacteria bacterium]